MPLRVALKRGVAAGLAALVLSACGHREGAGPRPRSFHTVKQMVAAMKMGGVTCTSLHASIDQIASDSGVCKLGGTTVTLDIYRSRADRDRALQIAKGMVSSGAALVGPDWTLGTRSEMVAKRLRAVLGGVLQSL